MSLRLDRDNERKAHYMTHNVLYDMADDYFKEIENDKTLLVNLKKTKHREPTVKDIDLLSGRSAWMQDYQWYFPSWFAKGRERWTDRKCEDWFHDNSKLLIGGFFCSYGYRSIGHAILSTSSFNFLCYQWDVWFEGKRRRFMDKYSKNILKKTGAPAKMPSSHGGIANLLKTLTKTMQLQGASIQSIAKVQYAICTQAGVYIPDEFITDVAVGLDYGQMIEESKNE